MLLTGLSIADVPVAPVGGMGALDDIWEEAPVYRSMGTGLLPALRFDDEIEDDAPVYRSIQASVPTAAPPLVSCLRRQPAIVPDKFLTDTECASRKRQLACAAQELPSRLSKRQHTAPTP